MDTDGRPNKDNDTPSAGGDERVQDAELPEDESGIILDQDQTNETDPTASNQFIGSEGNDNPPLSETSDFLRGEVDLVDQMDRAIRAHDVAAGLNRQPRERPPDDGDRP